VGRTATIIAVSYAVVCLLAVVLLVVVALSTRGRRTLDRDAVERLGEREKTWFAIVVVLLVTLLFATIFFTPYGRSAGADAQIEKIDSLQFAWLVPGKPLKAGKPVEFRLTARDVSHGFGVYTSGGRFLFQVQVLPGETQTYVYTFKRPGTYKILCLEYCGLDHDRMQSRLTVIE
jgi:cytochrome c oxidase subunit II